MGNLEPQAMPEASADSPIENKAADMRKATVSEPQSMVSGEAATKKKSLKWLWWLLGGGCLLSILGVIAFVAFVFFAVGNSPQSQAVTDLFDALDKGSRELVEDEASGLIEDLYDNTSGSTLAEYFKGNVNDVSVNSVSVTNDTAVVEFTIDLENDSEQVEVYWNSAELRKVGENWEVVYVGPSNSPNDDDNLFDY